MDRIMESEEEEEEEVFFEAHDEPASLLNPVVESGSKECKLASLDVWKQKPGTIAQRRECLLTSMGLHPTHMDIPMPMPMPMPMTMPRPMPMPMPMHVPLTPPVDARKLKPFNQPRTKSARISFSLPPQGGLEKENNDANMELIFNCPKKNVAKEAEISCLLGLSPITQEVMRRERVLVASHNDALRFEKNGDLVINPIMLRRNQKKKMGWARMLKHIIVKSCGSKYRIVTNSPSSVDYSDSVMPKRVHVHAHHKAAVEFTGLHLRQEVEFAHHGPIWSMEFSPDGFYLASAGQDRVIRVWEVNIEQSNINTARGDGYKNPLPEMSNSAENHKVSLRRKKQQSQNSSFSESFVLSEKPKCSFVGHTHDILDLSWSKSQSLLSSSMDKTVRLWHISQRKCLKVFAHNDYVTCIQFNPVDDGYFISGSLDHKVRIWSIKEHQVVDWLHLREMVSAACYTPDGKGAVVGSYKGTCRFYKQSGNKLALHSHLDLRSTKKGKSSCGKKITGFQFIPGDPHKVLITSSDSQIRLFDGTDISCKFKGFCNTKNQISASATANGKYVVSASEDSRVCIWSCKSVSASFGKDKSDSYEDFCVNDVLVALPWPGMPHRSLKFLQGLDSNLKEETDSSVGKIVMADNCSSEMPRVSASKNAYIGGYQYGFFSDKTWPEENLGQRIRTTIGGLASLNSTRNQNPTITSSDPACGLVIVTSGLGGEIRVFQNLGLS